VTLKLTIVAILMAPMELGATQWTMDNGTIVVFLHVKLESHAIQPGYQVLEQPAKVMQKIDFVLMGRTDLTGRRVMGHSKIGLTVKEEQHLSALNVAVKTDCLGGGMPWWQSAVVAMLYAYSR